MSYIRIDKGLTSKPKFRRIQRLTGLSTQALIGHLVLIWVAVDELGEDFEGEDIDIAEAVSARFCASLREENADCAQTNLICAMLEVGWATRFDGGIRFHSNDYTSAQRAKSARDRARRSYEAKKSILRDSAKSACEKAQSAPLSSPHLTSPHTESADALSRSAPTANAPRRGSKPKDTIAWSADGWSGITDTDRTAWATAYPACDIAAHLARADQWLRANPAKAHKTLWRKFITGWLARAQERGGDIPAKNGQHAAAPSAEQRQRQKLNDTRKAWGIDPLPPSEENR